MALVGDTFEYFDHPFRAMTVPGWPFSSRASTTHAGFSCEYARVTITWRGFLVV